MHSSTFAASCIGFDRVWQFASVPAVANKAYLQVTVYLEYSYNCNTAYFDGIQLFKEEFGASYTYDTNGRVTAVKDLQNTTTSYTYYGDTNNIAEIKKNGNSKAIYSYDEYNNVTLVETVEGVFYGYTYDVYGNNTSVSIGHDSEITSTATYTTDGNRLVSTTDALGKVTTYSYNADTNILEWVQYPEDTPDTRTLYTYDNMYRLTLASKDVTGEDDIYLEAYYTYENDRLTQLYSSSTGYSFAYNPFGQRTGINIGARNLATYTYTDDQNRYLSRLDYGNADSVQYTYDDLGRVILETYEDGSTVAYAYDNTGALATVTDSETGIKTTYYYDFTDRLMKYVEKGTGYSHSVGYEYDVQNRLTKLVETINGAKHTTTYTYDEDNRVVGVTSNGITYILEYDVFGRLEHIDNTTADIDRYYYFTDNSAQVYSLCVESGSYNLEDFFAYDDNGSIIQISDAENGHLTCYTYDNANQLIREDNSRAGKTWTWEYDDAGNIISKKEYAYTIVTLGTPTDTITYAYTDPSWGDLLTSYDGKTITYDAIGNPLNYGDQYFQWKHGRQLQRVGNGEEDWIFTYDANGMRTKRMCRDTGETYTYVYNGGQLTQMARSNGNTLFFTYDPQGYPAAFNWNGSNYYYVTNLQGDVIAILDGSKTMVVEYSYDAWGKILAIGGSMATTLGTLNPLTYRGYVYDHETELYYVSSRYYNPAWGRFLNADVLISTGQGMLGNNMFAYCRNNPVSRKDISGYRDTPVEEEYDDDVETAPIVPDGGGPINSTGSVSVGQASGIGSGGNGADFSFKSDAALAEHFQKHNSEFGNVFNTPQDYLDTANYVIQNGEYVANQNAYVKFYGMNGGANFAFVGMSHDGSYITTFHLKHVSQICF